jgi:hypothetical protein
VGTKRINDFRRCRDCSGSSQFAALPLSPHFIVDIKRCSSFCRYWAESGTITVGVKLAGRGFASDMRRKGDRMIDDLRKRSTAEVFEDHLRLANEHRFEEDIQRNVSPDIVVLERRGIFRGHKGVRELVRLLERELPGAPYVYTNRLVEGRVAFLEWTAQAEHARVSDGADSFLIEDGWIVAQTIHYTVDER